MSLLLAGSAGLVVLEGARARLPDRQALLVAAAAAAVLWQPGPALLGGVALAALIGWRKLAARRQAAEGAAADVPLLAELVLLGLTSGLPLAAALQEAAAEVHNDLAGEVRRVLRLARRHGLGAALLRGRGPVEPLLRLTAGAGVTGAPLGAAVAAYVEQERHAERARRLAAARKLPVRLLLPLALLILPGFVVLTVGPTLLGALDRLAL